MVRYANNRFLGTIARGFVVNSCCLEPTHSSSLSLSSADMGLGKTLSMIALILAQPPPGRLYTPGQYKVSRILSTRTSEQANAVVTASETSDNDEIPTLIALRKYSIHALRKAASRLLSKSFDSMKKTELVKVIHNALVSKQFSVTTFESAIRDTAAKSPKAAPAASCQPLTLIVAPVSVLSNWQDQIDSHVAPHTLRVGLYLGAHRRSLLEHPADFDVWITSYHTLQYDYRPIEALRKAAENVEKAPETKKTKLGPTIFDIPFFRVVLDEAHMIRNPYSGMFRACTALQAERRWCLTATPLTNKPEDVQSLLEFLRLEPLCDRNVFRRAISQPIKDGDETGLDNLRLSLAFTALRRTKDSIALPVKTVELRAVKGNPDNPHQRIYDSIYQSARAAVRAVLRSKDKLKISHSSVFEILTRLRQACCSGGLVPKERIAAAEEALALAQGKDNLTVEEGQELLEKLQNALHIDDTDPDAMPECAICMEELSAAQAVVLKKCFHVFCNDCLKKTFEYKSVCAFCRQPYTQGDLIPYDKAKAASSAPSEAKQKSLVDDWDALGPSPKMDALLVAIEEMAPDEKGVVFSQFTKFLDQLEGFLSKKGWPCVRIDGSKSRVQRLEAIQSFSKNDGGPRLILCSLHAAGTGINLTRGNNVFLMDVSACFADFVFFSWICLFVRY